MPGERTLGYVTTGTTVLEGYIALSPKTFVFQRKSSKVRTRHTHPQYRAGPVNEGLGPQHDAKRRVTPGDLDCGVQETVERGVGTSGERESAEPEGAAPGQFQLLPCRNAGVAMFSDSPPHTQIQKFGFLYET